MIKTLPPGYTQAYVLVLGRGITSTHTAWGDVLLQLHDKQRTPPDAGLAISSLSYSGDGFYYYNPATGNSSCGDYGSTYASVGAYAKQEGIPYQMYMVWYSAVQCSWVVPSHLGVVRPC